MEYTITENINVSVSMMPIPDFGMTTTSQPERTHSQGWKESDRGRKEFLIPDLYSNIDLAIADLVGLSPIALSDWYTSATAGYQDGMTIRTSKEMSSKDGSTGHSPEEAVALDE